MVRVSRIRQLLSQVQVMQLSMLQRKLQNLVQKLLLYLIQTDMFMILMESSLKQFSRLKKLKEDVSKSMLTEHPTRMLHIQKDARVSGALSVISHFHVLLRMRLMAKVLNSQLKTDASQYLRVLICLLLLKLLMFILQTICFMDQLKPQMQVVLQHQVLR